MGSGEDYSPMKPLHVLDLTSKAICDRWRRMHGMPEPKPEPQTIEIPPPQSVVVIPEEKEKQ